MYSLEKNLVKDFEDHIEQGQAPFSVSSLAFEFDYRNGRVDIIGKSHDGSLLSFEAKLTDWKKALNQAYRNTGFSHYSYVVLPRDVAVKARKHSYEFTRRKVGLCFVDDMKIGVEIPALRMTPIQPWLTESAMRLLEQE
jgi:hypothetical protein